MSRGGGLEKKKKVRKEKNMKGEMGRRKRRARESYIQWSCP